MSTHQMHTDLQQDHSDDMRRRRAIIRLSLLGIASMSPVSLYQAGLLKRLPDLPLSNFDSEKVTRSPSAYWWGAAEGAWAVLGCALNLPLATFGGSDRARDQPLIPLIAATKGVSDAAIAAWYLYEMPTRRKAWCTYSIIAALVDLSVFGLTLPEARKALAGLLGSKEL